MNLGRNAQSPHADVTLDNQFDDLPGAKDSILEGYLLAFSIRTEEDQHGVEGGNLRVKAGVETSGKEVAGISCLPPEQCREVDYVVGGVEVDDQVTAGIDGSEDEGVPSRAAAQDV